MRTNNRRSGQRGWMWVVVATIAALLSSILWGSTLPAAAQSASIDPGRTSSCSPTIPDSCERVLLPLVLGGRGGASAQATIFGIQLYSDPSSPEAVLPLAKQAQVSWIHYPVRWAWIEPVKTSPPTYQFGGLDWALGAIPGSGLNLILTVGENPSWASTYSNGVIDKVDINRFAQFMGALVERYDGDGCDDAPGSPVVDYWEFYNEPDAGSPAPAEGGASYWGPFASEYAEMLCAVYPVMKAASPRAQIVMGGLAYDWFEDEGGNFVRLFLDNVLAAGGGHCLDVMNFHYYPGFEAKWAPHGEGPSPGLTGKANYLRNMVLTPHGLGDLPMIATEAGHHSNPYYGWPSTPEIQAGYVVKLFAQSLASNLRIMIWWTWSDWEIKGWWGKNGLLAGDDYQSLNPKPAYYAYQTAVSQLGRAVFQRFVPPAELGSASVQAYLFQRGGPLYVMWSSVDSSQTVTLPGKSARVKNYVGSIVAEVADGDDGQPDGRVHITVGSSPVYVEVVS